MMVAAEAVVAGRADCHDNYNASKATLQRCYGSDNTLVFPQAHQGEDVVLVPELALTRG